MPKTIRKLLFITLCFLLVACNLPKSEPETDPSIKAWFEPGLDGSTLPLAINEIAFFGSSAQGVTLLELSANDELLGRFENTDTAQPQTSSTFLWLPPATGSYLLSVRAQNKDGAWSDYDLARVNVAEVTELPSPTVAIPPTETSLPPTEAPTLEALPTDTATIEPSPSVCFPTLTLQMNANCRTGPSQAYKAKTSYLEGMVFGIEGRNKDSTWWYILNPDAGGGCFISDATVKTSCLSDDIKFVASAPVILDYQSSVDKFYMGTCEPQSVTLLVRIMDESGIQTAKVTYRLKDKNSSGATRWMTSDLTYNSEGWWGITIYGDDIPKAEDYAESKLEYSYEIVNKAGLSTKSGLRQDISHQVCP